MNASVKPFLDTNVPIYAYTGTDDPRAVIAKRLVASGGLIGVQQLNEFVFVARRKLRKSWQEIRTALEDLRFFCPVPIPLTERTHEAALDIGERHGYPIYDSLVIASALEATSKILYSEDMQHNQRIQGLTIRNPFSR